jgi:uncharacterized glyoxalase superfamily protein PhnB
MTTSTPRFEFYAKAIGMVPIAVLPDEDGHTFFARMRYRGTNITLNRPGWDTDLKQTTADSPPHFIFYLYVDDVHQTVSSMEARGATSVMAAGQTPWGDLRARVARSVRLSVGYCTAQRHLSTPSTRVMPVAVARPIRYRHRHMRRRRSWAGGLPSGRG